MDPLTLAILLGSLGGVASMGLGQVGKYGERQLRREEIAAGERVEKTKGEVTKRLAKESRKKSKEYTEQLIREKRSERISDRETLLMQSFIGSQDRQMALIMQAMQGISKSAYPPQSGQSGSGMVGLLRSNL